MRNAKSLWSDSPSELRLDLEVTFDSASLASLTQLNAPLVLCPTHRSLLDFVLIGLACFQLRPLVPALQVWPS